MLGSIYLITCNNNKRYVGQHGKENPKRRFREHINYAKRGSQFPLYRAMRKHGVDAFTFERLCTCPIENLTNMEAYYAEIFESYVWDSPGGYNAVWCSESPMLGVKLSPEAIEKMRQAKLGKKMSPEAIEKMRQAHLGMKMSPEAIAKRTQARLGRKLSPEHIEKMRQANLGKKKSPECIEKMRQAQLGKKKSPEHIEKVRQANLGKKMSPESIAKTTATRKANKENKLTVATLLPDIRPTVEP